MIYNALNCSNFTVATGVVSMWSPVSLYSSPVFLRFRFKEIDKSDKVYLALSRVISDFKGNVDWVMITTERTKNYGITLKSYYNQFVNSKIHFDKISSLYETQEFERLQDLAVLDIPELSKVIEGFMKSLPPSTSTITSDR